MKISSSEMHPCFYCPKKVIAVVTLQLRKLPSRHGLEHADRVAYTFAMQQKLITKGNPLAYHNPHGSNHVLQKYDSLLEH